MVEWVEPALLRVCRILLFSVVSSLAVEMRFSRVKRLRRGRGFLGPRVCFWDRDNRTFLANTFNQPRSCPRNSRRAARVRSNHSRTILSWNCDIFSRGAPAKRRLALPAARESGGEAVGQSRRG